MAGSYRLWPGRGQPTWESALYSKCGRAGWGKWAWPGVREKLRWGRACPSKGHKVEGALGVTLGLGSHSISWVGTTDPGQARRRGADSVTASSSPCQPHIFQQLFTTEWETLTAFPAN